MTTRSSEWRSATSWLMAMPVWFIVATLSAVFTIIHWQLSGEYALTTLVVAATASMLGSKLYRDTLLGLVMPMLFVTGAAILGAAMLFGYKLPVLMGTMALAAVILFAAFEWGRVTGYVRPVMQPAVELEPFVSVNDTKRIEHLRQELLQIALRDEGTDGRQAKLLAERLHKALMDDTRELEWLVVKVEEFFDGYHDVSLCEAQGVIA